MRGAEGEVALVLGPGNVFAVHRENVGRRHRGDRQVGFGLTEPGRVDNETVEILQQIVETERNWSSFRRMSVLTSRVERLEN